MKTCSVSRGGLTAYVTSALICLSLSFSAACTIPDTIDPGFIPGMPSLPGNPKIPVKPIFDPLFQKQQDKICNKSGDISSAAQGIIDGSAAGGDNPACQTARDLAGQAGGLADQACQKANACAAIKHNKALRDQCMADAKALNDQAQDLLEQAEQALAECLADPDPDPIDGEEISMELQGDGDKHVGEIIADFAERTTLFDTYLEMVILVYDQLHFTSRPDLLAQYDGALLVGVADVLGVQDAGRVVVYPPNADGKVVARYFGLGAAGQLIGLSQPGYHPSWDDVESKYDSNTYAGREDVCYLVGTFTGGLDHTKGTAIDFCESQGPRFVSSK